MYRTRGIPDQEAIFLDFSHCEISYYLSYARNETVLLCILSPDAYSKLEHEGFFPGCNSSSIYCAL